MSPDLLPLPFRCRAGCPDPAASARALPLHVRRSGYRARPVAPHALHRMLSGVLALFAFAALGPLFAFAQIDAPAKNWALPLFTPEGFRSAIARGTEARAISERQFAVTDLSLTFFSGDASARVDTVILSPAAVFEPDPRVARGDQRVRYIRDDIEASGVRWTYWHADKKISLDGDVRVTFRAEIKDLLR